MARTRASARNQRGQLLRQVARAVRKGKKDGRKSRVKHLNILTLRGVEKNPKSFPEPLRVYVRFMDLYCFKEMHMFYTKYSVCSMIV